MHESMNKGSESELMNDTSNNKNMYTKNTQ